MTGTAKTPDTIESRAIAHTYRSQCQTGWRATLGNTLHSAVTIGAGVGQQPSPSSVQSSTCGISLAAGSTCKITVMVDSANVQQAIGDSIITSNGGQIEDLRLTNYRRSACERELKVPLRPRMLCAPFANGYIVSLLNWFAASPAPKQRGSNMHLSPRA